MSMVSRVASVPIREMSSTMRRNLRTTYMGAFVAYAESQSIIKELKDSGEMSLRNSCKISRRVQPFGKPSTPVARWWFAAICASPCLLAKNTSWSLSLESCPQQTCTANRKKSKPPTQLWHSSFIEHSAEEYSSVQNVLYTTEESRREQIRVFREENVFPISLLKC